MDKEAAAPYEDRIDSSIELYISGPTEGCR